MKFIYVGDLRAEIKFLHFLQMGEILDILFQLPHAPSTLANCYHMRRLRQQSATTYTCNLLPYAPSTLEKHTILHGFATACAVYASNLLPHAMHMLANCYLMRCLRQQFATVCAVYTSNLQPHAPSTLTNSKYKCYSCLFQARKQVFCIFCLISSTRLASSPRLDLIHKARSHQQGQISSTRLDLIHKARSHPSGQISSTRLDLIHEAGSHPQGQILSTRLDLIHMARSHPLARSHPQGQISSMRLDLIHEARSHPRG